MPIDKRKDSKGEYFAFYHWDGGKRIRIKQDRHKRFEDRSEAEAYDKILFAGRESEKARKERCMAWRDKYQDFEEILTLYEGYQKQEAPNSYKEALRYLKQYVFDFFLNHKKNNNAASWHLDVQEYRDWVAATAISLRTKKPLSYSSKNKALHAFNSFLECLGKYRRIPIDSVKKCEIFEASLLGEKDYESVIGDEEFVETLKHLKTASQPAADAWEIAYYTGMRINEILSLSMAMLRAGHPTGSFGDELHKNGISCGKTGYVVLTHQLPRFTKRDPETGKILVKKPLKGRKKIHAKYDRVIPIPDVACWNTLVRLYKAAEELMKKRAYGSSKDNYLLFEDVNYTEVSRALAEVYAASDFNAKTYHDGRHTFCTNFVGKTRSFFLARAILGHKSDAFERYLHIFERISKEADEGSNEINFAV